LIEAISSDKWAHASTFADGVPPKLILSN